jgi:hypothetical protein
MLILVVGAVRGHLAAFAEVDEIIGAVPVLDDIQPLVDLPRQFHRVQISTQKSRFDRLAQLLEHPLDGML